jgi:4-amino-4-deoxy-L-arabinose transferase-like glycosyltransferase
MASPTRVVICFEEAFSPGPISRRQRSVGPNPHNACMRNEGSRPGLDPAVNWITAGAFVLRLVARLLQGIDAFWVNGYTFFFDIARNIAAGKGIAAANGIPTAFRVPFYPIFLAGLTLGHQWFWPVAIAESLIGAATAFCAALLARQLFPGLPGRSAATLAALITAVYPYYVVHDTAMQETSLFTLLTVIAVLLALRTAREGAQLGAALCGLTLGLDVLTRSPIAPFALLVPIWLLTRRRLMPALLCLLVLGLTVAPWLVRNDRLTGRPVLTTEAGFELWNGNNPTLFDYYPMQSVDVSIAANLDALSARDQQQLAELGTNEVAVDHWYQQKALAYMRAHPWLTVINGLRKIGATFDWLPTPRRSRAQAIAHFLSFGPVMLLGLWGFWMHRASWRDDSLVYLLFAQFLLVTAVYFGQTNHRVFLDVYLIVFAAGAIASRFNRSAPAQA